jgi:hypothetical protein
MGYRRPVKAFRLKFADEDMAGLEVTARSLPIGEFLNLTELATLEKDDAAGAMKATADLFRVLAGALMSWNLEDDFGDPVPADYDGIVRQELDFVMKIVNAWMSAMAEVDIPLPPGSAGGVPSGLEQSLPMVPSSPPPPS